MYDRHARFPQSTDPGFSLLSLAGDSHETWKLSRCYGSSRKLGMSESATFKREEVVGWQAGKAFAGAQNRLASEIKAELQLREKKSEDQVIKERTEKKNKLSNLAQESWRDIKKEYDLRGFDLVENRVLAVATVIKGDHKPKKFLGFGPKLFTGFNSGAHGATKREVVLYSHKKLTIGKDGVPDSRASADVMLIYFVRGILIDRRNVLTIKRSTVPGETSVSECSEFGKIKGLSDAVKARVREDRGRRQRCVRGPLARLLHAPPPPAPAPVCAQRYDGCGAMDAQKQDEYFCMCVPLGQNVNGEESSADTRALVMRMLVEKIDEYFLEHLKDAGSNKPTILSKGSEQPKHKNQHRKRALSLNAVDLAQK